MLQKHCPSLFLALMGTTPNTHRYKITAHLGSWPKWGLPQIHTGEANDRWHLSPPPTCTPPQPPCLQKRFWLDIYFVLNLFSFASLVSRTSIKCLVHKQSFSDSTNCTLQLRGCILLYIDHPENYGKIWNSIR